MHDDIQFTEVTQNMVDAGQRVIESKMGVWPSAQMVLETYLEMVKAKPDNEIKVRESVVMQRLDWTDG